MIKYKISNIRDLIGHKVDLEMVNRNPICLLEKAWIKLCELHSIVWSNKMFLQNTLEML